MSASSDRVFPYPSNEYTNDAVVQERLTTRSIRGGRVMAFMFFGFFIAFLMGVVGGLLGFPLVAVSVIPLGFILPVAALLYLHSPKCQCSSCGREMKRTWAAIDPTTGRQGQFLICEECRLYAYTHKAERP